MQNPIVHSFRLSDFQRFAHLFIASSKGWQWNKFSSDGPYQHAAPSLIVEIGRCTTISLEQPDKGTRMHGFEWVLNPQPFSYQPDLLPLGYNIIQKLSFDSRAFLSYVHVCFLTLSAVQKHMIYRRTGFKEAFIYTPFSMLFYQHYLLGILYLFADHFLDSGAVLSRRVEQQVYVGLEPSVRDVWPA